MYTSKFDEYVFILIRPLQLKSIYLYGHCTGAAIAYDVCKTMKEAGMIVCKLCVCATYLFVNETDSGYKINNEEMYNFIKEIGGILLCVKILEQNPGFILCRC